MIVISVLSDTIVYCATSFRVGKLIITFYICPVDCFLLQLKKYISYHTQSAAWLKALKPANGRKHYPTIYMYCTEVQLSFCNDINENFETLKMQVNGPFS